MGARPSTFTKGKPVNKSQLIDALAARFEGNKKQASHALESVLDTITREVAKGEKVAITGFGSFEKRVRDARWVRNPRTGERIKAKKTAVPKFNPGADLKAVVSGAKKVGKHQTWRLKATKGVNKKAKKVLLAVTVGQVHKAAKIKIGGAPAFKAAKGKVTTRYVVAKRNGKKAVTVRNAGAKPVKIKILLLGRA